MNTSGYEGRAQRVLVHLSEAPCCDDSNTDLQKVQLEVVGSQPRECLASSTSIDAATASSARVAAIAAVQSSAATATCLLISCHCSSSRQQQQ
jgi:hypothetical protein